MTTPEPPEQDPDRQDPRMWAVAIGSLVLLLVVLLVLALVLD